MGKKPEHISFIALNALSMCPRNAGRSMYVHNDNEVRLVIGKCLAPFCHPDPERKRKEWELRREGAKPLGNPPESPFAKGGELEGFN